MNILDTLRWRYASKAMNGEKVAQEKVNKILEAINLAPTSLGMQAYKVFVVENQDLKNRLCEVSKDQQPVAGCSHLLIFAARTELADRDFDAYQKALKSAGKDDETCTRYMQKIKGYVGGIDSNKIPGWLICQTYIALGVACVAAANEQIDSVPMEGFDKEKVDEILSLKEKGYTSTLLLPLGYRDQENDWNANGHKVRKGVDNLVELIK